MKLFSRLFLFLLASSTNAQRASLRLRDRLDKVISEDESTESAPSTSPSRGPSASTSRKFYIVVDFENSTAPEYRPDDTEAESIESEDPLIIVVEFENSTAPESIETDEVPLIVAKFGKSVGFENSTAPQYSPLQSVVVGFCVSGDCVVEVLDRGVVAMKDLSTSDKVKVEEGKFYEVYSFGHYDQRALANYLPIDAGLENSLIITPDHMVFVEKKAIPASTVKIGDKLPLVDGIASVKRIKSDVGTGAPFTKDGTVVVNDVVASSYVSLQPDSASLVVGGIVCVLLL